MSKTVHILKGLGYAYITTLIVLLIYNLLLTYTGISANSVSIVTSFITTMSAAVGGFYACMMQRYSHPYNAKLTHKRIFQVHGLSALFLSSFLGAW